MNKQYTKEILEIKLRHELENFPLYHKNHWVLVHILNGNVSISYAPIYSRIQTTEQGKTHFDIQINGETCYILDFYIGADKRGNGNGKNLCSILERFCKSELGCKRFITTPSGQGKGFWPKMGFKSKGNEAEKVLE